MARKSTSTNGVTWEEVINDAYTETLSEYEPAAPDRGLPDAGYSSHDVVARDGEGPHGS